MDLETALNFQQKFEQSDDIAAVLGSPAQSPVRVDASGIGLGPMLELLVLKRGADRPVAIADSSKRGRLLRRLLKSTQPYLFEAGRGVLYRRANGTAEASAAANDFANAFRTQLAAAGVAALAALRLSGALHELLDNVGEHAGERVEGLGAFDVRRREAWMVVADSGRGVMRGYQASLLDEKPADAEEALKWAVVEHRSRTGDSARGTGFRTVVQAVRSLDGHIRVRSDMASIELEQTGDRSRFLLREQGQLRGFVVSVLVRW